jgi:NAD(P)-dependent dehydrogenase (short-subunit alcohol dehydrogenase family)
MALTDKVALVTGAGRGIGKAISLALAGVGATVALAEIDAETLEATASEVGALGRPSLAVQADIGNLVDIDRMVQETVDVFGRIDILVNNAGVTRYIQFMDVREEDWDRIHRVNAKGAFFSMQRVAKDMIRQGEGGRIVNIASIAGKGYQGASNAAYAASKGAVISMTTNAAHQLGGHDINVNAICPGVTLTEGGRNTRAQRAEQQGGAVAAEQQTLSGPDIPIGRANDPEDVAAMAVFLSGPGSRNITGQTFNVDGGLVMQ